MKNAKLSRRVFGFDQATIDAAKYGKLIGANFRSLGESVLIASMDSAAREANKAITKIMEASKCP